MIEFAFVLSTLILGTLGMMDVSRFIWAYNEIENAVDIAARCGAVDQYGTCPSITNYFNSYMIVTPSVTVTSDATASCGKNPYGTSQVGYKVTATYNFIPIAWPLTNKAVSISRCYPTGKWG